MSVERVPVAGLPEQRGVRVRVCGWVAGVHDDGRLLLLRDRTGVGRLVLAAPSAGMTEEAAVDATGTVVASEDGGVAVAVDVVEVVGRVLAPLPVDASSPLHQRLDWRFLDLRRRPNLLTFEVQTTAERAMRRLWADDGFVELHSPKLRSHPNASGRELFTVGYFGADAYLAQSPQFYKQMAMAAGFERVFEIGPVFRANPHVTDRHDTEFVSVDVELSWIASAEDVMAFEERWLHQVVAEVAAEHGDDIRRTFGVEVVVPEVPFPRIPLEAARTIVEKAGPAQPPGDLDPAGERVLGEHVVREHGHELVFVTEYPAATRPFYHMRTEDGSDLTRSFDLLWKGLEVTTGAQREHRYDRLVGQARDRGVALEPIDYYLDCFRFGCPPHGGFGFGLTRMLMCLLGRHDVRDVTFLHRGRDRLRP
ncbi:MAG TPA: aspartate--tRNA(Asn) ligase [Acidimicrobiales bacterium]|nr:aspartate--tRNA(Asn) ligase [Acidimicrobiales bacterium]